MYFRTMENKYALCYFIILSLHYISAININKIGFASQFLYYKNIQLSRYFTCWNSKDTLHEFKLNAMNAIRSTFITSVDYNNNELFQYQDHPNKFGYVLDTSCQKWKAILEKATKLKFPGQQLWLLLHEKASENDVYSHLKDVKIRLDSKIYVAQKDNDSYFIFEYYNPGFNSGGELITVNTINYTQETFIARNTSWYDSRKNLSSVELRVLIYLPKNASKPLEYLEDQRNRHEDTFIKIAYAIFQHIIQIHKFRWTPIITPTFFAASPHDSDRGLGKTLLEDGTDLCVIGGLATKPRVKIVDFLTRFYIYRSHFAYRQGSVHGRIQNVIFTPFSSICWLCILLLTLLLLFVLVLEIHFEHSLSNFFEEFIISILSTISVFCQQGIPLQCRYYGGRLLLLSFLIFSLLLSNYYTSSIVSSLINNQQPPFKTLGELIQSKLKLGLQHSSYLITYFKTNRNTTPDLHLFNKELFSNNSKVKFLSPYEGVLRLKAGGFAYHSQSTSLYKYMAQIFDDAEICATAEIRVLSDRSLYLFSPKQNQYNKLLTISYAKIFQVGLLQRQQKLWDIAKPHCLTGGQFVQVGLEQAAPVLLILMVGIGLAFIIFLLEKFYIIISSI